MAMPSLPRRSMRARWRLYRRRLGRAEIAARLAAWAIEHRNTLVASVLFATLIGLAALDLAVLLDPGRVSWRLAARIEADLGASARIERLAFGLDGNGSAARAQLVFATAAGEVQPEMRVVFEGLRFSTPPLSLVFGGARALRVHVRDATLEVRGPIGALALGRRLLPRLVDAAARARLLRLEIERLRWVRPETPSQAVLQLERLRVARQGEGGRRWELRARYRRGRVAGLTVRASIDLDRSHARVELRGSNVPVDAIAPALLPAAVARAYAALRPRGPVDLDLRIEIPHWQLGRAHVAGTFDCYALSLAPRWLPAPITNVTGSLHLDGRRLEVPGLRGLFGTAVARLHGSLDDVASGAGAVVEAELRRLELRSVPALPLGRWRPLLEALELGGRAGVRLSLAAPRALHEPRRLSYEIEWQDATAAALRLQGIRGTVRLEAGDDDEQPWRGRCDLARARLDGLPITALRADLRVSPDLLLVRDIDAEFAGGRLRGSVAVRVADAGVQLDAELRGEDVQLAPLAAPLGLAIDDPTLRGNGRLRLIVPESPSGGLEFEAELGGGSLESSESLAPLGATLEAFGCPVRFETGRLRYVRGVFDTSGTEGGRLTLQLSAPSHDVSLHARLDPTGRLRGLVVVQFGDEEEGRTILVAGPPHALRLQCPIDAPWRTQ